MAAKSEFSKNHKKIRFVDISEISPERYITGHKETIESLKNRVNFPDSCPLSFVLISTLHIRRLQKQSSCFPHANPYISNVRQGRWSHFRAWVACDKICTLGRDLELSNLQTRQEGSMADRLSQETDVVCFSLYPPEN